MTAKITTNRMRSLPAILPEPHHFITMRCASRKLLAALQREHPSIVAYLTSNTKNAGAHNHG